MSARRILVPALGWAVLLGAAWWVLVPRSAAVFTELDDPGSGAMLVVRLIGLVLVLRLSAAATVAVLGALLRSSRLVLSAERLAPRSLRPIVNKWCTSGLLLVATTTGVAVPAHAALAAAGQPGTSTPSGTAAPPPPTMWRLGPADEASADGTTTTTAPPVGPDLTPDATPDTRPDTRPDIGPGDPGPVAPGPDQSSTSTTEAVGEAPSPPADEVAEDPTWTIMPGQHLWGIAEQVLGDRLGRSPAIDEVATYHQALIAANRHRLADPANPDLVFAGQVVSLPA